MPCHWNNAAQAGDVSTLEEYSTSVYACNRESVIVTEIWISTWILTVSALLTESECQMGTCHGHCNMVEGILNDIDGRERQICGHNDLHCLLQDRFGRL